MLRAAAYSCRVEGMCERWAAGSRDHSEAESAIPRIRRVKTCTSDSLGREHHSDKLCLKHLCLFLQLGHIQRAIPRYYRYTWVGTRGTALSSLKLIPSISLRYLVPLAPPNSLGDPLLEL